MKKTLSLLSLILALVMLLGVFAACGKTETAPESTTTAGGSQQTEQETGTSANAEATTGNETTTNSEATTGNEVTTGSEANTETGSETTVGSEPSGDESSETTNAPATSETEPPSIDEIKNGELIESANALANGVNAYFTDGLSFE